MFWILMFVAVALGAGVHIVIVQPPTPVAVAEIGLLWIAAGWFGVGTLVAGMQHVFNSEKIASYIGWTSNGFQRELGWSEVGLGIAGLLAIWLHGPYVLGPVIVGSALYLGAAGVHAGEMVKARNFKPGNAGPVFYLDILVPVIALALVGITAPWA